MAPIASPLYPFKEAVIFGVPDEAGVYSLYFGADQAATACLTSCQPCFNGKRMPGRSRQRACAAGKA